MSRHRNVRTMDVDEEYEGYDDVYGHSVEDYDYCVSPATAEQFTYDRTQHHALGSYMSSEPQIPEEDNEWEAESEQDSLQASNSFNKPNLSELQQGQLYSCLESLRNILGDSTPEHILVSAVIEANFDNERALNAILSQQEMPKPQRELRQKRERDEYTNNSQSLLCEPTISKTNHCSGISQVHPLNIYGGVGFSIIKDSLLDKNVYAEPDKENLSPCSITSGNQQMESIFVPVSHSGSLEKSKSNKASASQIIYTTSTSISSAASSSSALGVQIAQSMTNPQEQLRLNICNDKSLSSISSGRPVCLSQLAAEHNFPGVKSVSQPTMSREASPRNISLSKLSTNYNSLATGNSSRPMAISMQNIISNTPPQTAQLTDFFGKSGTPLSGTSLSDLAEQHATPPDSASQAKSLISSVAFSLSDLAKKHENIHRNINLSDLAKHQTSLSNREQAEHKQSLQAANLASTASNINSGSENVSQPLNAIPKVVSLSALTKQHDKQFKGFIAPPKTGSDKTVNLTTEHDTLSKDIMGNKISHPEVFPVKRDSNSLVSTDSISYGAAKSLVSSKRTVPPGFEKVSQFITMPQKVETSGSTLTMGVSPPPGFEKQQPKPRPSGMLNLSDLAAQHQTIVFKPKNSVSEKFNNIPIDVPTTQASLFAKTLCVKLPSPENPPQKSEIFQYNTQMTGYIVKWQLEHTIDAFDFSTPSPDDIVKTKQKAAFSRESFNRKCGELEVLCY